MARPRNQQDEQLIEQAMYCFWSRGYSNTGMRELESSLKLRAPAIYNRFGSKQALFESSLNHYLQRIIDRRIQLYLSDACGTPGERLAHFMRSAVLPRAADINALALKHPKQAVSCMLVRTALDPIAQQQNIQAILRRAQDTLHNAFAGVLAPLCQNPAHTARQLLLCFNGLMISQLCGHSRGELQRQLDAALALIPLVHEPDSQPRLTTLTQ